MKSTHKIQHRTHNAALRIQTWLLFMAWGIQWQIYSTVERVVSWYC